MTLAMVLAAAAAWLLIPHPAAAVARLAPQREVRLKVLLPGRPGGPATRQRLLLAGGGGVLVALLVSGVIGIAVGVAVAAGLLLASGRWGPAPRTGVLRSELPDALDFLAVCLDAGLPMRAALETVARVSPAATRGLLEEVAARLALGRAGPSAWEPLRGHEVWGRVAADVARAERSGTTLSGILRVYAADARQERRDDATKRARTVGVRSALPLMVCFLPAFVAVGVVPIVAGLLKDFLG